MNQKSQGEPNFSLSDVLGKTEEEEWEIKGVDCSNVHTRFKGVIEKAMESMSKEIQFNFGDNIRKEVRKRKLPKGFQVISRLTVETVVIHESSTFSKIDKENTLILNHSDFLRLVEINNGESLPIERARRHCVAEELVAQESSEVVRSVLRRWKDNRSSLVLNGKKYLMIKDLPDKLRDFQAYLKLDSITIRTWVFVEEIGDIAWAIQAFLPGTRIGNLLSSSAETDKWELLPYDERECTGGHLSFDEAIDKLRLYCDKKRQEMADRQEAENIVMGNCSKALALD
ncbi:hypothetical protein ACFL0A_01580 [Patescibacteria group bacterium]